MGGVLLTAALVGAVSGCVASLAAVATRRPSVAAWGRAGLVVAAVCTASATLVLGRAFAVGDLSLVAVVDHSREALDAWGRIMGLWGGMAGSLLLFVTLAAVLAAIGLGRRGHPVAVAMACGVVGALVAISRAFADPFATLRIPALDGSGLTPILEHWAMRVHPPVVYAGMTVLLVPAARTLAALADRRLDAAWWRSVHAWLVASWLLLGFGMLLGAAWAYVELGWGGYWAWDPVENAALLPWLAVTVALHAGQGRSPRVAASVVILPFLLALLGATLTRSGATSSVHAFAEARDIGLWSAALLAGVAAVSGALIARAGGGEAIPTSDASPVDPAGSMSTRERARATAQIVVGAVLAVVLLGTLYPLVRGWLGGDRVALQGYFFSEWVWPIVVVGLLALVGRGHWPSPWAMCVALAAALALAALGWRDPDPLLLAALAAAALAVSLVALARTGRIAELAHVGLALLLVGIAGTATGSQAIAPVTVGGAIEVGGHSIVVTSIHTEPGPTDASTAVVASVVVDGHDRRAALVAHPDRGVLLAESTLRSTPAADVQVILRNATDDVALLIVNVAPLQQLVWLGALVMLVGGAGALVPSGPRSARQPCGRRPSRRARWESSNDPNVDDGRSVGASELG